MAQQRGSDGKFGTGSKLTPELASALVDGVIAGLFDAQNALRNGIDTSTLKSWVDRGLDEEAEEPFKSFAERYLKATIDLEESVVAKVLEAADEYERLLESVEDFIPGAETGDVDSFDSEPGPRFGRKTKRQKSGHRGDWRAAAWYLERRWPLRWGNRAPEGGPKDALKLPDAPMNRRKKVQQLTHAPTPEIIKAFRDAGYDLVKREKAP